jgi:hypothetical protein
MGDARAAVFDGQAQLRDRGLDDRVAVARLERARLGAQPRIGEQVVDQRLHALGAVDRVADEFVGIGVEPSLIVLDSGAAAASMWRSQCKSRLAV